MFQRIAVIVGVALLVAAGIARTSDQAAETNQPADIIPHDKDLENIPAAEAEQIKNIVELTQQQMAERYKAKPPILRGVHPKDHGCVEAMFRVLDADKLPPKFRVGVFAEPGRKYKAWIRFSTSGVDVKGEQDTIERGSNLHRASQARV